MQETENLPPVFHVPAGQFPDHERVANDAAFPQEGTKARDARAQVIHPDRRIDQDQGIEPLRPAPPSTDGAKPFLASSEVRQALGARPGDQGLQAHPDERSFLPHPRQASRFCKRMVIDVQSGSHTYKYALFMHLWP